MCTVIALHRCVPGAPLLLAANRDEYLDRPSEEPRLRSLGAVDAVAPLDLRAGGTWQALSAGGLFAAVTNRRCAAPDPSRESRGNVVVEALQGGSADAAAERLSKLDAGRFNPFNAFVADRDAAYVVCYEDQPRVSQLDPGPHVIGNLEPDDTSVPKQARALAHANRASLKPPLEALATLADACREHVTSPASLDDTCIHLERYGTRSSTLLMLADRDEHSRLAFADGAPCRSEYTDFTSLLRKLSLRDRLAVREIATRNIP